MSALKNEDIVVMVYRRPNMFIVNENLFNLIGVGELKNLFHVEDYVSEPDSNLTLFYPERFLNLVEQKALITRIINAKNYTEVKIITNSVFIIQSSKTVKIANVGENLSEQQFKLSHDNVGTPCNKGITVL